MVDRIDASQLEAARALFEGAESEAALIALRDLSLGHSPSMAEPTRNRLRDLGWIGGEPATLTPRGQLFADSSREYCNWRDDGGRFPVDLLPESVEELDILDVGCGFGRYVISLRAAGARAFGVDVAHPYLQLGPLLAGLSQAAAPIAANARAEHLPFRSESFDVVLCLRAIAYMEVALALRSFERVLRPGGLMLFATPTLGKRLRPPLRSPQDLARRVRIVIDSLAVPILGRRLLSRLDQNLMRRAVYPPRAGVVRLLRQTGLTQIESHPQLQGDVCWFVARKARAADSLRAP